MQFVIYAAGLIPSMFFEVLGGKEFSRFQSLSIYAIVLIVLNAVVSSRFKLVMTDKHSILFASISYISLHVIFIWCVIVIMHNISTIS